MSSSVKDIIDGIYTKLNATSTFKTAVGGRIHAAIGPADSTLSHAVFNVISVKYLRNFSDNDDVQVRVQVDIYSPKTDGLATLADICQKLETLMDMTDTTVSGYAHGSTWSDEAMAITVEGEFLRARTEYIAYLTDH